MDFVRDYLKEDLALVHRHLDRVFQPEGELMAEVARYVGRLHGKMLRPAIVALAAKAHGYDDLREGNHARLGASVELFHVATLLHDDVIDKAPLRRGEQTINAKWGDDVAILFADYLYASCFDLALSVLQPEIVRLLSKTTQKMTEGEMYQIEKRTDWLSVEDYYSIIQSKTAYLFAACSSLGAMTADAPDENVAKMFEFGLNFGMAFQITDDALDYEAQGDKWGKRVGADLKEGKQTLPLLYTLAQANEEDRAELIHILNNGRDFPTVHRFVRKYGSIDHSLEVAADYSRKATEALEFFDDSEPINYLRRIAGQVLVRQT